MVYGHFKSLLILQHYCNNLMHHCCVNKSVFIFEDQIEMGRIEVIYTTYKSPGISFTFSINHIDIASVYGRH